MKTEIDMGLPTPGQPFSWAIGSGDLLFTTHGPVTPEGGILQASTEEQAHLTFQHFRSTVEAAGGTMDDYLQLQIFLTDLADVGPVDAVSQQYFRAPSPNRATIIVAALVAPGMKIEVTGIARVAALNG
jgi:2-iminobutanoate/2-iminopropanoate deaminase